MSFKAKVSIDSNGVKEERSVLFIQTLLLGRTKNNIDKGTTQSNIDGYIELLDSSNRINGKITVQVKTVSQKDEGHNRFPCPTSLFAYAETTTDNVFLLAVDHSQDKVLYKHISQKLLDENRDKEQQETITLHCKPNEELRKDNIEAVLKDWLSICSSRVYCLTHGEAILEENSELKSYLLNMPKMATDLRPCDIQAIQNFIDSYNKLLESDFRYIKSILFPNVWKRGIAIYTYSAKKIDDTKDVLQFVFTEPVVHSVKKFDDKVEINLYNSSGFNHDAYKKGLNSEVLSKLRTEQLKPSGIKVIIPIKSTTLLNYQESFDNKQLKLTIFTPKEEEIKQSKPTPAVITRNPNVRTIVIDAGHGGTDVGATREGYYEKDITLDIAERLEKILKKKGFNVLMTRDKDIYVSLQDRVQYTEDNKGDLFVSIHVNSSVTPEGNGLETHYYTPQSYDFAQIVHKEFVSAIDSKDRGLFKSKFYVINHTTCPSILVETGFISNPEERKELLTSSRKQKTAEAIAKGILKYLGKD